MAQYQNESVKKEDDTSDDEEPIQYRNPYIDSLDFESAFVKSEGDDTIDQNCITSSESTVEQFDQLDVNTDDFLDSSELLISEVQKRPLLYDVSLEDYNDRNKKAKCWEEVYKQMINNWSELSPAEKNNRGRIIQKRWRSIRDSFMKAYKKMSKLQSKKALTKRKKYVYFDQMMFIIPTIEKRKNSESSQKDLKIEDTKPISLDEESLNDSTPLEPLNPIPTKPLIHQPAYIHSQENESSEIDLTDVVEQIQKHQYKVQEIDEDRMFLLSLLPSFKKMNDDGKLALRIEILQIIRQALHTNRTYSSVTQTPQTFQTNTSAQTVQNTQTYSTTTGQASVIQQWQQNIPTNQIRCDQNLAASQLSCDQNLTANQISCNQSIAASQMNCNQNIAANQISCNQNIATNQMNCNQNLAATQLRCDQNLAASQLNWGSSNPGQTVESQILDLMQ